MSIYNTLYSWQQNIVDNFINRQRLGLFLDMGLGKTPLSLAFAEQHLSNKILVVTLNSKALEDADQHSSWLWWASKSNIKYNLYHKTHYVPSNENEIYVVNYEMLFKRKSEETYKHRIVLSEYIMSFINNCHNDTVTVIVDESHKLKNLQSKQTLAINEIIKQLSAHKCNIYLYLLTGTPFTKGYEDLYSQLKLLGCNMTKTEFIDNYCIRAQIPGLLGWQQPIVSYKNVEELFKLVHEYAITIKTETVIKLPESLTIDYYLPQSTLFSAITSEKMKVNDIINICNMLNVSTDIMQLPQNNIYVNNPFYRNIDYPSTEWLSETSGTEWLRARQMSIGFQGNADNSMWYDRSRLEQLKTLLSSEEHNYLIFYNYVPELLELYELCEKLGYNIDVYCGHIKSLTHYNYFMNLTEDEKLTCNKNVIIANFASGAVGLNWQGYHHCILFSCPLYKDFAQGSKRVHRIGQTHTVIYHRFIQDNWLEKSMINALNNNTTYSKEMFECDKKRVQQIIDKEDG